MSTVRWIGDVLTGTHLKLAALIALQVADGVSVALYAWLLKGVVDAASRGDGTRFARCLWMLVGVAVMQVLLRASKRWLTELIRATAENRLKERTVRTLLSKDLLAVTFTHSAEWHSRLTSDAAIVADGYAQIAPSLVGMSVRLVAALAMIAMLDVRLVMVVLPLGAGIVVLTAVFRKALKRLHKEVQEADASLRRILMDHLSNLLVIHSFVAEPQAVRTMVGGMDGHRDARMHRLRFSNICSTGFGMAMSGVSLLCVAWCGRGILEGTLSFGTLTAVTQLVSQIRAPFANLSGYLPRYYAMLASAERLMDVEALTDADAEEPMSLAEVRAFYDEKLAGFGLRGVTFAYPLRDAGGAGAGLGAGSGGAGLGVGGVQEEPPVLRDLDLEVRRHEFLALTGPSGCGKSTAMKLLMGAYVPTAGSRVLWDDCGREAPFDGRWRRLFAYVPQGNRIGSGTIREAVCLADVNAAGEEGRLRAALESACATEFVDALPEGVDTRLGERGTGLSEGQAQRLAIARAVFSGSPVLLLDEATSALDAETELRVLRNIRALEGRTVVVVTHRPAALSLCDREVRIDVTKVTGTFVTKTRKCLSPL